MMALIGCASTADKYSHLQTTRFSPKENTPRLGDAEISFEKTYGKPFSVSKRFKNYSDDKFTIQIHYSNGIAESILYYDKNKKPLDDYWTSRILSLNSQGKAWIVRRDSRPRDLWYRTPDCKLIANLYKQRTLLVSTSTFRQWLLDQSGKGKLTSEQSKVSIFYPDCASVFLGHSESKMTSLLGNPSISTNNANVRVYRDKDVTIRAQFDNGQCEAIKYLSLNGKLTEHWVSATLALNSAGVAWVADEEFRRGEKRFVTTNGKLHAVLKAKGHELMLYTEELNQRTMKRLFQVNSDKEKAVLKQLASEQVN
jgi:hypothetical protein